MSGAAGAAPAHGPPEQPPPEPLLARTWARHHATILEQVAVVERAVSGSGGADDERLRGRGAAEAHKLAGSVGTFGFDAATEQAHELEQMLTAPGPLAAAEAAVAADLVAGLRQALEGPPEAEEATLPGSAARAERATSILVIDDDVVIADRLAGEAIARGLRARTAFSPAEGRALAARERPDLVLLDLTFVDGTDDAYALLSELTAEPSPVLVLVLTVRDTFVDRVEVARRGGRGFAAKSQSVQKVLDHAVQLIERTRTDAVTLLAVDDDRVVLDAISTLLRPHGITVVALHDPELVWQELERARPDIVMLDVDMPGTTGLDICRVLRNDHRWATVPVLFLTRHSDPATVHGVFAAGADDYLTKPIVPAELLARIRNRLERFALHRLLAETDTLTGVANRSSSTQKLEQLVQLAQRFDEPLSLAIIDLDGFKTVNDRYGHALGDTVLQRMGDLLRQAFRGEDVVGRWGGEEFVVGMYGMMSDDARRRLLELLGAFTAASFTADDGESFSVSFSAGLAQRGVDGEGIAALHRAADAALYRAKRAGRARVTQAQDGSSAARRARQAATTSAAPTRL